MQKNALDRVFDNDYKFAAKSINRFIECQKSVKSCVATNFLIS